MDTIAKNDSAMFGYARVSTKDQSLQSQRDALIGAGCTFIYDEHESGMNNDRPQLKRLLQDLTAGDTLVVFKLDRLSRSLKDLIEIIDKLQAKGVALKCTSQPIDTSNPLGKCFFHIVGAIGELEREQILERTRAGLEAAKRLGRYGGRPRKFNEETISVAREQAGSNRPKKDIAKALGMSRASLYRLMANAT